VLEECDNEEQCSIVRFCGQKNSMKMIFIKKCFLFTVESVCRVKGFTAGSRQSLKDFLKSQMMERRCGIGWDRSKNTSVLRVSTHW
jgi:hypothetical protein